MAIGLEAGKTHLDGVAGVVNYDHVHAIPASWTFGGVLSAARFAELLADAVTGTDTAASGS